MCKTYMFSTLIFKRAFHNVVIIGGGLMGSGIAQANALAGYKVFLLEKNEEILIQAQKRINANIQKMGKKKLTEQSDVDKFVTQLMNQITFKYILSDIPENSDLVIEAIAENLDIKKQLLKELDLRINKHAVFASNTSSFSINEIASACPSRVHRFVGLHFFNPVTVMKLVEIILLDKNEKNLGSRMVKYVKSLGKEPVLCKDTPGFIVNRLLIPYLMQAILMYERGDATKEDIDQAMKLGAGYPMGPFELLDYVGLDTAKSILDGWRKKYPNDPLFSATSPLLDNMIAQKKLGKKSGSGFYEYK